MSDDQVLPCPFCGAEPTENAIEPHTHHMKIDGWPVTPDHGGSHVIECACGAGMISDTREAVLAMWNRRPVQSRNVTQKEDAFLRNAAKECSTLVASGRLIGIGDDETMARVSGGVHGSLDLYADLAKAPRPIQPQGAASPQGATLDAHISEEDSDA